MKRIARHDVARALRAHPTGITASALSVEFNAPPSTIRAHLRNLEAVGSATHELKTDLYRPLTPSQERHHIRQFLDDHPGNEYGHQGVREALPWLHLTPDETELHLRTLHALGRATHAHDPTDDPWHWYGSARA